MDSSGAADEIALAIQARHLCTPMVDVVTFGPDDPVDRAHVVLTERGFDFAPVVNGGEVVGYVRSADLAPAAATVGDQTIPLTSTILVSGDSAVAQLMGWLADRHFLFVIEGRDIIGIVTPSDLNKQAGRTYFYLLVAGLEMALADLIRRRFASQADAAALLSPGRRATLDERITDLARRDTLADTVAAMDFVDLMTIVKKTPELLEACGSHTPASWQRTVVRPISGLRNDVMHSVRALTHDNAASLKKLTDTERTLRELLNEMLTP